MLKIKGQFRKKLLVFSCAFAMLWIPTVDAKPVQAEVIKTAKTTKKVELSNKTLKLNQGKTATLKLLNTKEKPAFTSSNTKVATVNKTTGRVAGKNAGTATITAKLKNGKKYTCKVTVTFNKAELPQVDASLVKGKELAFTDGVTITLPEGWDYELYEHNKKILQYICLNLPDDEYKGCVYISAEPYSEKGTFKMTDFVKKELTTLVSAMQKDGYLVQWASSGILKQNDDEIGVMTFKATKESLQEYETVLLQKKGDYIFFYECIGTSKAERKQFSSSALYMLNSLEMDTSKEIQIP